MNVPAILHEGDTVLLPEGGSVIFRTDGKQGRVRVEIVDAPGFSIRRRQKRSLHAYPPPRGTIR